MSSTPLPGSPDDRASLSLGNDDARICESYEVRIGILEQPNGFSLRLGHADIAAGIIQKYPSNTPFALSVGGIKQFSGSTDGYEGDESTGGTTIVLSGRDDLKRLTDSDVSSELTFTEVTYPSLVQAVLAQPDVGLGSRIVTASNAANRKIRAGVHVLARVEPQTLDQIIASPDVGGTTIDYVTAHVGENWWQLLSGKLKYAGLFLWNDAFGNFVLSQPNGQQSALYRIERWKGKNPNLVNAEHSRYRNNTAKRHSQCLVYSRIGHGKNPRGILTGSFTDQEMVSLGYSNKRVLHDKWCTSTAEGNFMARRALAEERRESWGLTYEVGGHTTRCNFGGTAVWTPDTIVEVRDDWWGIDDLFYLESVEYRGTGGDGGSTNTTLHLLRLSDLIFGADE